MVGQCVNLYENDSTNGTLFISVDDSKFLIKFYSFVKVELLPNEEIILPELSDASKSRIDESVNEHNSEEYGKWGDYLDLSQLPSEQIVPKTSQKVVKAESGQYLTITSLDEVFTSKDKSDQLVTDGSSETVSEISNTGSDSQKTKKRKLSSFKKQRNEAKENLTKSLSKNIKTEIDSSFANSQESNDIESFPESTGELSHFNEEISSTNKVLNKNVLTCNDDDVTTTYRLNNSAEREVHSCRDCYGKFDSQQALKDHRKVKNSTDYQCDECSEVFQFQAFLEVHKKSNHGSVGASLVFKDDFYWYSCDTCGKLSKTLIDLQVHNLVHTGEGPFQCCLCPQKFREKSELNQHIKGHKSSGMIRCRWCNKWFADKSTLGKHKLLCKEIRCHLCDNIFPNKTSRNQHYKDFHPNDILKCELCHYMFSSQEELEEHMEKHSKFKKKQCTLCGLFFSRLKKHMLIHKNPDEYTENEIFYCDKCPAKFNNQSTFARHRKNHMGDKPYQCPNCPRTFTNCGVLYKHIKRHKSLLPYTCEVCGLNCASIDQLKSHMLTHSEDNILFPCSVCTQSFMYRSSLESHMQMKHPQTFSSNITNAVITESGSVRDTRDFSTAATSFVDNTNSLMEVVIPGISDLVNSQTPKYEVVIVQK